MATYKTENDPNNPDAVPLYNDNILKVWNWFDTVWNCNDWMTWHKVMKAKYGKEKADNTFLSHWNDLATGSSALDCRSFNTDFRAYMSSEKLLDSLYSGIGIIAKPLGTASDVVTSVGKAASSAGKTVEIIGKVVKVAVPVVLITAVVFGGIWAYKKYVKK